MLHLRTATAPSCPQIRKVMHGGSVRCRAHYKLRVLAPTPGCLSFHTSWSKWMSLECVEILPLPHLMKRVSHMLGGGGGGAALISRGGVVFWRAARVAEPL